MSCIITYKGKKYSEEQFKEYFNNNKQEFVSSIASNKNVIDSFKRKMEDIDYVFSQSPELASIGTKAQYLQYLSTIFKTSKVKDIVYHGTNKEFDKFESNFTEFVGNFLGSKQDIEGFKEFVNNKSSQVENIEVDGVPNINNEEKSLKLALKGLTPEEKISFCNHFGITMTEENGKKC